MQSSSFICTAPHPTHPLPRAQAEALVLAHAAEIAKVAEALMEERRLTGRQVARIAQGVRAAQGQSTT